MLARVFVSQSAGLFARSLACSLVASQLEHIYKALG